MAYIHPLPRGWTEVDGIQYDDFGRTIEQRTAVLRGAPCDENHIPIDMDDLHPDYDYLRRIGAME